MRILFCNYEYPPLGGGGGVVNAMLAEALAERGHRVVALTSRGLAAPAQSTENGVEVVRVPVFFRKHQSVANLVSMAAYIPQAIRMGIRLLARERFDVINTHFVVPTGPVGDWLSRRSGIPNVLSLHGGDLYDPSKFLSPHRHWPLRLAVRRLLHRADLVVGQSSNTLDNMRRYYAADVDALRIPLGIRRPPEGTARRSDYAFAEDDVLIAAVGRLVARKAVDQLLDTIAELRAPRLRLLVIGDGPLRDELARQASALGVGDNVRMLGHVDEREKFRILRMCDAYASTSQHEGFGLVFLEAMAAGLPVVCYDNGGQTDFLREGMTGFLVPLNDRRALARAVRRLADDAALRRRIGAHNRAAVEEFFIEHCAERYEAAYSSVITPGAGGIRDAAA
jgi:glycosyltransferase involved in cell wall biosynthesis